MATPSAATLHGEEAQGGPGWLAPGRSAGKAPALQGAADCYEQRARILSAHSMCAKFVALSEATWAVLFFWRPQVYRSIGQLTTAAGDVSSLKHMHIYVCARLVAVIG